jgi:peptidoglycan/xylan/chitin deacetylase (PgdA/CDA1 family)
MSIGESHRSADASNPYQLWSAPPSGQPSLVRQLKARLIGSRLRTELRGRPGLQGRILAPAGALKRLPSTPALYSPFYHDVPPRYAGQLIRHLQTFSRIGEFVSWDDALDIIAGRRELTRPAFCLSFDDADRTWIDVALPILAELRIPATFFVVSGYVDKGDNLTWQDCRDMLRAGMSFGSHSRTHRRLLDLDDATAADEIRGSKAAIEDQLGVEIKDFAAPYGWPGRDFLARDVASADRAGYRSFASTFRAPMRAGSSPLCMSRQGLHPAWPLRAVMTRVHE